MRTVITQILNLNIDTGYISGRIMDSEERYQVAFRLLNLSISSGCNIQFEHEGETIVISPKSDISEIADIFEPSRGSK